MPSFTAAIDAWGTARLGLSAIPALRKSLPAWVPESIAGHFLKYTDEQTVAAVSAIDRAIQSHAARTADFPFFAPNPPII